MHLSWNGHRHLTADSLIWSRCETIFLIEILKTRQPCSCYHVWVVTRGPPAERTYSQNGLLLVHTTRERFVLHCEAHAQFGHAATWSIKTRSSFSSNSVRARSSVDIVLLLCFISSCTRGATCQVPQKKITARRVFLFFWDNRVTSHAHKHVQQQHIGSNALEGENYGAWPQRACREQFPSMGEFFVLEQAHFSDGFRKKKKKTFRKSKIPNGFLPDEPAGPRLFCHPSLNAHLAQTTYT